LFTNPLRACYLTLIASCLIQFQLSICKRLMMTIMKQVERDRLSSTWIQKFERRRTKPMKQMRSTTLKILPEKRNLYPISAGGKASRCKQFSTAQLLSIQGHHNNWITPITSKELPGSLKCLWMPPISRTLLSACHLPVLPSQKRLVGFYCAFSLRLLPHCRLSLS